MSKVSVYVFDNGKYYTSESEVHHFVRVGFVRYDHFRPRYIDIHGDLIHVSCRDRGRILKNKRLVAIS